jgi:hypothetical protein
VDSLGQLSIPEAINQYSSSLDVIFIVETNLQLHICGLCERITNFASLQLLPDSIFLFLDISFKKFPTFLFTALKM